MCRTFSFPISLKKITRKLVLWLNRRLHGSCRRCLPIACMGIVLGKGALTNSVLAKGRAPCTNAWQCADSCSLNLFIASDAWGEFLKVQPSTSCEMMFDSDTVLCRFSANSSTVMLLI